jgi:hypothetical protein
MLDNVRISEDRNPVILPTLGRLNAVHAKATGQASDTTKDRLESLCQMMRNEIPNTKNQHSFISPQL